MGIIGKGLKFVARKTLLVAVMYGGKQIAGKIAGKMVEAAAKKKAGQPNPMSPHE